VQYLSIYRVLGQERLLTNIFTDWGNDIKRNQIPKILGGVGPLHSVRQLCKSQIMILFFKFTSVSGFVELFNAPVEAYKRDGRVLRGVKRGASAFSNSTAVAALELSSKFFDWIDFTASFTHDFVRSKVFAINQARFRFLQTIFKARKIKDGSQRI
jgi:autophagy-related protein 2